jgi:nucleotide-binding universal stress UspA family protein
MSALATHPILLCYDGSAGSRRAIETAGPLFPGRKAIVLHAWSRIAGAYGVMVPIAADDDVALRSAALALAQEGTALAAASGLGARPEITEASFDGCWHAILRAAELHDAALIVLGARGLSTFKSLVLGSVSHGVVQHAHRPVLVVPPAAAIEPVAEPVAQATVAH